MKKLFIILLILSTGTSYAQNNIAKLGEDFKILLASENNTVEASYVVDISNLSFISLEAKTKYFKSLTGNLERFELTDEPNKVVMILNLEAIAKFNWAIAEWNAYFEKKSSAYLNNYNTINPGNDE